MKIWNHLNLVSITVKFGNALMNIEFTTIIQGAFKFRGLLFFPLLNCLYYEFQTFIISQYNLPEYKDIKSALLHKCSTCMIMLYDCCKVVTLVLVTWCSAFFESLDPKIHIFHIHDTTLNWQWISLVVMLCK